MPPAGPASLTIYAHRGARAHAPENTLLAFALAFDLGADAIECDVQITADGALVIFHDDTLNRTTNGRGPVAPRTLAELRALDAGLGQRIPTLDEVLALCAARGRTVNLEVKAATPEAALATAVAMEPVLAALDDVRRAQTLVSSFELSAVAELKRRLPWLRVAMLYGGREWRGRDLVTPTRALGAEAVHPGEELVTPSLVERAHQQGLRVNVWTANHWSTFRRMLACGVDGVFTDYSERGVIVRVLGGAAFMGAVDGATDGDAAADAT